VLFSVEAVFPEWTFIVVGHMVAFAINAIERVGAQQTLSGFEARGVKFQVGLATLC